MGQRQVAWNLKLWLSAAVAGVYRGSARHSRCYSANKVSGTRGRPGCWQQRLRNKQNRPPAVRRRRQRAKEKKACVANADVAVRSFGERFSRAPRTKRCTGARG